MSFRALLVAAAVVGLTGCYNNPKVSERRPGEGPVNYMSKPSVGPGTVAGGSTAGPQPKAGHETKKEPAAEGH
jgi:hypothetical protein